MACARAHEEWSTELWPFTRTVRGVRAIRRDSHALPSPHAPTRQLRISALLMLLTRRRLTLGLSLIHI